MNICNSDFCPTTEDGADQPAQIYGRMLQSPNDAGTQMVCLFQMLKYFP